MAVMPIIIYPDPLLRKPCLDLASITPEVTKLLSDMADTMYNAVGIGLAASQVGSPHRVIVVDVKKDSDNNPQGSYSQGLLKIINPKIRLQEGQIQYDEGCLSIPDVKEKVVRSAHIVVDYINPDGQPCSVDATGLLAVCLQHEIDHLDGILFIDRLSAIRKELVKGKLRKLQKEWNEAQGLT